MPNAYAYRAAAARFRRLAVDLEQGARTTDTGALAAGPVRTSFDDSMHATQVHLGRGIAELRRLAGACEQRADVCAEYARAVGRYSQLDVTERLLTRPPTRPAIWVEL